MMSKASETIEAADLAIANLLANRKALLSKDLASSRVHRWGKIVTHWHRRCAIKNLKIRRTALV